MSVLLITDATKQGTCVFTLLFSFRCGEELNNGAHPRKTWLSEWLTAQRSQGSLQGEVRKIYSHSKSILHA